MKRPSDILKTPWSVAISVALLIAVGYALGAAFAPEKVVVRQGTAENPAAESSVNLMLDYGNGIVRTWNTVTWHESMSALDLLEEVAGTKVISTEKETIDGKDLLRSVDGIANDPKEGRRWQFWVNNVYEPRVISKTYLKPGDIIVVSYAKE